jgi:chromosome segregation and condensation protein ScpB
MNLDFSGYDLVVLCTPIWSGRPACPTRTFLRDAKLDGRKLALMFSNSGSPFDKALEVVKEDLAGRNVEIVEFGGVVTKEANEEQLKQAAEEFGQRLKKFSLPR